MIFYDKDGDFNYAVRKRDLSEAHRVSDIELDYLRNIKFQEELFDMFKTLYDRIRSEYKDKQPEVRRPILDHCLDCWTFFWIVIHIGLNQSPKNQFKKQQMKGSRFLGLLIKN